MIKTATTLWLVALISQVNSMCIPLATVAQDPTSYSCISYSDGETCCSIICGDDCFSITSVGCPSSTPNPGDECTLDSSITCSYDLFCCPHGCNASSCVFTSFANCDSPYGEDDDEAASSQATEWMLMAAGMMPCEDTACPTPVPTLTETPSQSPSPTVVLTTAPTSATTAAPSSSSTATASVELTIGMSGLTCADYGTAEEAVVNAALASTIDGTASSSFGAHSCTDENAGDRRALLCNGPCSSVAVAVTAAVDASAHGGDVTAVAASVATVMAAAVSDSSFAAAIATEATSAGLSTLDSVAVTTAVAVGAPTPAPTVLIDLDDPIIDTDGPVSDSARANASMTMLLMHVCFLVVAYFA